MPTITSEEAANNVWVVTPSGRVDAALAPGLEAALESQLGKGNAFLVVDFASVSYVASSGLKALLSARRKIKQAGGAPEEELLSDRPLQVAFFLWGLSVVVILYLF